MLTDAPALPPGLTTRPLRPGDAAAVHQLMAAQELADIGMVEIEEADIVADWARPSHDLAARSIGVFDGDRMVGYGELIGADRADSAVHPDWRGRGIGTWLAAWLRDLGRRVGSRVIGMPVPEGSPADRLLAALGYHVRWHSWVLQLPAGASVPDRPLPDGYTVRQARPQEYPALHDVVEDAFLEWSQRERETYEDFTASVLQRPGFEPWLLRVAIAPEGSVAGAAILQLAGDVSYVSRLAVRRELRNCGLAQALLVDAFAVGREHGGVVAELSTDSRTGALGLYQKVGMVVTSNWVNRAIDLDSTGS